MIYSKKSFLILLLASSSILLASGGKFSKEALAAQQRAQQGKHEKLQHSPQKQAKLRAKVLSRRARASGWCPTGRKKWFFSTLIVCSVLYGVFQPSYYDDGLDALAEKLPSYSIPTYVHNFPHPGIISAPTNIVSEKEVSAYLKDLGLGAETAMEKEGISAEVMEKAFRKVE